MPHPSQVRYAVARVVPSPQRSCLRTMQISLDVSARNAVLRITGGHENAPFRQLHNCGGEGQTGSGMTIILITPRSILPIAIFASETVRSMRIACRCFTPEFLYNPSPFHHCIVQTTHPISVLAAPSRLVRWMAVSDCGHRGIGSQEHGTNDMYERERVSSSSGKLVRACYTWCSIRVRDPQCRVYVLFRIC
jgi:hypothetical protein